MEKNKEIELVEFPILVRRYKTTLSKKYLNRKFYKAPNPNEVLSHIPGTIINILVKEGQKKKKGETILILEAMKMMNEVVMPFDGKVVKINVKKGEKIPKGFVIMELTGGEVSYKKGTSIDDDWK